MVSIQQLNFQVNQFNCQGSLRNNVITCLVLKSDCIVWICLGQNNFGRRMSLATLGNGKYGRADDRNGTVVVRHIPIIIEGQEDEAGK